MLTPFCLTLLSATLTLMPVDESRTGTTPGEPASTTSATAAPSSQVTAGNTEAPEKPSAAEPTTASDNAPAATAAWLLRYKFQEGQKLRYQTTQKMTLTGTVGEKKQVDVSELKQRRMFTILNVDEDGSSHMAMQFENVWMQKKADNSASVEFDSSMKPADVPYIFRQVARDLKGSAPKFWLSNLGRSMYPKETAADKEPAARTANSSETTVTKLVEDEPQSGAVQLVAGSTPDPTIQEQKKQTDPGSFLMTLPEKEIQVGQTWKETIVVPARMQNGINIEVSILRTFRLESVENGIARISFRCSIESLIRRDPTVAAQLIQATPRGILTIDINRGLTIRREMHYDESVFGVLGADSILASNGTNIEELIETDSAAIQTTNP